jgi:hypothetical protein
MNYPEPIEKFMEFERQISKERGRFTLFALFVDELMFDRWDLIVSAPWFSEDKGDMVEYFAEEIKSRLGLQELVSLSRIAIIRPADAASVTRKLQVEHGIIELRDRIFFGVPVRLAYIITSQESPSPVAA